MQANQLLQLQPSGVQPQKPPEDGASAALEPFDDFPALNTDSCKVWRLLAHFGQVIFWPEDITRRSKRVWQSSQTYS